MLVSFGCLSFSIGGLILDKTVSNPNLAGIIVYAPVINGEFEYFNSWMKPKATTRLRALRYFSDATYNTWPHRTPHHLQTLH